MFRHNHVGTAHTHRKRVGVVLSGGGAKGVAHARALKVIEQAGIPVDFVVGTSMGSIVGGLYAAGYTADQIDSLIRVQDWQSLLTDKTDRKLISLADKQNTEKYMLSLRFDKNPFEVVEGGLIKGNKIGYRFSELTADLLDSIDFRSLPIPFACVATDIVTEAEVEMHSGILAECMRSSMAIPGVFSPIKRDSMVLVDGGLVNNFPVDVARRMGADIVIGVDVTSPSREYQRLKSALRHASANASTPSSTPASRPGATGGCNCSTTTPSTTRNSTTKAKTSPT